MVIIILSLLYSTQEIMQLSSEHGDLDQAENVGSVLNGILYNNQNDWQIWIDNKKISPKNAKLWKIESVSKTQVCFEESKCVSVGGKINFLY